MYLGVTYGTGREVDYAAGMSMRPLLGPVTKNPDKEMFMSRSGKFFILWATIILMVFAVSCKKKAPAPPPPPPPVAQAQHRRHRAAAPVIAQFAAEPASIQRGQSSTLRWQVTGTVTNVSINQGVGTVQSAGSQRVQPGIPLPTP